MMRSLSPRKRREERCKEARARMSEYLDGELDERHRARLEHHLRWCPGCRRMLTNLGRTVSGLKHLSAESPVGD